MNFSKPAINPAAQLLRLKDRGLEIRDDAAALNSLDHIEFKPLQ